MSVRIAKCPKCRKSFTVTRDRLKQGIKCPQCGQRFTSKPAKDKGLTGADDPLVGQEFGGCRITDLAGHGALGSVYRARHPAQEDPVALKIFPPFVMRRFPKFMQNYVSICRELADIQHPNLVRVYQAGEDRGFYFTMMPFIEGKNLEGRISPKKIQPVEDAVRIARSVAFALRSAAEIGILHQNLKPANVFLCSDGVIRISDFGLGLSGGSELIGSNLGSSVLCPHYLSPEQVNGQAMDIRSDIYSLGGLFFHLVTGRVPFPAQTPLISMMNRLRQDVESPRRIQPAVSEQADLLIRRMMARLPDQRFNSYTELVSALDGLTSGSLSELPTEVSVSPTPYQTGALDDAGHGESKEDESTDVNDILDMLPTDTPDQDLTGGPPSPAISPQFELNKSDRPATPDREARQFTSQEEFEQELNEQIAQLSATHFPDLDPGTTPRPDSLLDFGDEDNVDAHLPQPPPGPILPPTAGAGDALTELTTKNYGIDRGPEVSPSLAPTTPNEITPPPLPGVPYPPTVAETSYAPQQALETPESPLTLARSKGPPVAPQTLSTHFTGTVGRRRTMAQRRRRHKEDEKILIMFAVGSSVAFVFLALIFWFAFSRQNEKQVQRPISRPAAARQDRSARKEKTENAARAAYMRLTKLARIPETELASVRSSVQSLTRRYPQSPYSAKAVILLHRLEKQAKAREKQELEAVRRRASDLQALHRWGEAREYWNAYALNHRGNSLEEQARAEIQNLEKKAAQDFDNIVYEANVAEKAGKIKEAQRLYQQIFIDFGLEPYVENARNKYAELAIKPPSAPIKKNVVTQPPIRTPTAKTPGKAPAKTTQPVQKKGPDFQVVDLLCSKWRFTDALEQCVSLMRTIDEEYLGEVADRKSSLTFVIQLKSAIVRTINQRKTEFDTAKLFTPPAPGILYRADKSGFTVRNGIALARFQWTRVKARGALELAKAAAPNLDDPLHRVIPLLLLELRGPDIAQQQILSLEAKGFDMSLSRRRLDAVKARMH